MLPADHIYAGHQAIVLLPSKPFPLMTLSVEVRALIWRYVLAPQGNVEAKITVSCATGGRSGVVAKAFNEGLKNRVGCLLASKEVS